jgi:TRAP-type mannitol/chloroaromatic compound transport system permease small subunit
VQALLKISGGIDWFSDQLGRLLMWLILATTLISAGNAIVRKLFDWSSNALLEVQWYLFATVFMLGAGYVFLKNAHVRIDFVSSRLTARTRNIIDIVGILIFLVPLCVICIDLGWPLFVKALKSGEMSQNAGGLIRWPAYFLIPAGFALLLLQAGSELIKRFAFLGGHIKDPLGHEGPSEEELLAEELRKEAEAHAKVAAQGARS